MSTDTPLDGRLLEAARTALWANLRLVVIDLETCAPPGGGTHRVVEAAAVTCRRGASRGTWSKVVNPGCPIDPVTRNIHGITDDLVADEPTFDAIAPELVELLSGRADERVVLVAHNVRSDVSVLRAEFARVGLDLPDVGVLDTMGRLARHVDVRPADRSLAALADTLGIVNARPHRAPADAQTCADAVLALLDRAAQRGIDDFDRLLAEVSRGATTATIRTAKRAGTGTEPTPQRVIDPDHLASHADVLSARVRDRGLAAWADQVAECCQLRCPAVLERVEQAGPAPHRLLPVLEGVLDRLVVAEDGSGVATLLPALLPLLEHLTPRKGRHGMREAVLAWTRLTPRGWTRSTAATPTTGARPARPTSRARWTPGANRSHRSRSATGTSVPAASCDPTAARPAPAPTPPGSNAAKTSSSPTPRSRWWSSTGVPPTRTAGPTPSPNTGGMLAAAIPTSPKPSRPSAPPPAPSPTSRPPSPSSTPPSPPPTGPPHPAGPARSPPRPARRTPSARPLRTPHGGVRRRRQPHLRHPAPAREPPTAAPPPLR